MEPFPNSRFGGCFSVRSHASRTSHGYMNQCPYRLSRVVETSDVGTPRGFYCGPKGSDSELYKSKSVETPIVTVIFKILCDDRVFNKPNYTVQTLYYYLGSRSDEPAMAGRVGHGF